MYSHLHEQQAAGKRFVKEASGVSVPVKSVVKRQKPLVTRYTRIAPIDRYLTAYFVYSHLKVQQAAGGRLVMQAG